MWTEKTVGGWRSAVVPVVWLAAALRLHGLFANTFHADEALFATWARLIAVWRDPLLAAEAVDKPPLLFYSQALFYPLFGPVEWAARMPSLIASLLLVPLTAHLAWRLSGDRVASGVAALVVALAPLAVQFSATGFSDPLLTFWLTAALVPLVAPGHRRQPAMAGFLFGLALTTKYQAALFLPLVIGLGWLHGWQRGAWWRWVLGAGVVLAMLGLWGLARGGETAIITTQWANIGGLRVARSWELWPRLVAQARLWRMSLGWPLAGLGAAVVAGLFVSPRARSRLSPAEALITLFVLAYALLHWLWAVPAWDRYLLPVLPLVAVLLGRGVSALLAGPKAHQRWIGGAALAALLVAGILALPIAAAARAGSYPLGGQPAADGGAALVAQALVDAPYGTVLYDHGYSWHWRYHLFDRRVYVSWFPHADALLDDLAAFGDSGSARYIALPASVAAEPVARRLHEAGYRLEPVSGPDGAAIALWLVEKEETTD